MSPKKDRQRYWWRKIWKEAIGYRLEIVNWKDFHDIRKIAGSRQKWCAQLYIVVICKNTTLSPVEQVPLSCIQIKALGSLMKEQ